jgi:hypothetical protein
METGEPDALTRLQQQVSEMQGEISALRAQLAPDALAKRIDSSYLSVNNLRAFLQILSLVMTVFVAGAISLGFVGFQNIQKIQDDAKRTEAVRQSTEQILTRVTEREEQVSAKVAKVDQAIPEMNARIEQVASQLRSMSQIFNKVALENASQLNPREQQVLFLLARESDPSNPIFNFNAAVLAVNFHRYDEAIRRLEQVLVSKDVPEEIQKRSSEMLNQAKQWRTNPPKVQYEQPTGAFVGDFGIVALPVNILNALISTGYLTVKEAQEVIDQSKRK